MKYTFDNPSHSLPVAEKACKDLLGENCTSVSSIGKLPARVIVEVEKAIAHDDHNALVKKLASLKRVAEAAEATQPGSAEPVAPVVSPVVVPVKPATEADE